MHVQCVGSITKQERCAFVFCRPSSATRTWKLIEREANIQLSVVSFTVQHPFHPFATTAVLLYMRNLFRVLNAHVVFSSAREACLKCMLTSRYPTRDVGEASCEEGAAEV